MSSDKAIVNSASSSFSFLEYYLQISLHATTARIQQAWALSNPHLTLNFEGRCKDILALDAWIDVDSLVPPNTEEDVVKRGFILPGKEASPHDSQQPPSKSPSEFLKVNVGSLKSVLSAGGGGGGVKGKIVKKLLLCKVGVGRSYFADEEYAKIGTIPEGYDSFYVSQPKDYSSISENSEYHHTYIVKDANQILPLYEVVFDYDPEWEKKSREVSK